jgi:type 2 lantibiotic biosynthesis protein LanM
MEEHMTQAYFETPSWYEALTLNERVQALQIGQITETADEEPIHGEIAQKRWQRWRAQTPFSNDIYFVKRLDASRLSEDDFIWILGAPSQKLRQRFAQPPEWLHEVERIYSEWLSKEAGEGSSAEGDLGFLQIARPLINSGHQKFQAGLTALQQQYSQLPFDPQTVEQLFLPPLFKHLSTVAGRTMVLELNVARVQERLRGETPEDRFKDFIRQLHQPQNVLDILQEYPVLARQLVRAVDFWVRNSLEFLTRLCADWPALRTLFPPTEGNTSPGRLVKLNGGAGDTHREGRSVMIAEFESGARLVYKPHSLAVDQHFGELLAWLNERGEHPPFRILKVLERGEYGWVEFVTAHGCEAPEQLNRFYQRLGAFLALLYVLDATDFHHENLLAVGENPVMVDLEALFHPRLNYLHSAPSFEFAQRSFSHSVLRVGLLPQQIWVNEEGMGLDLSGMGGAEGQQTPFAVLTADNQGTDEMRFVRKRMEFGASQNRPTLNGAHVSLDDHADDLVAGFTEMYRLLHNRRAELLAADGPLTAFADDEVRLIARATKIYAQVLQESYHPNVLRSALDRDRLLDRLWVGIDYRPELARLIPAEQADLQKGDIPFFASRPASKHVWTSQGAEVTNFLAESSLDVVRNNIDALSETDLSRQLWFIQSSLAAMKATTHEVAVNTSVKQDAGTITTDRQQIIDAASAIGDRLITTAYQDDEFVSWAGLQMVQDKRWSVTPLGSDLYSGSGGIAFFLAYLGSVTGDEKYILLARKSLHTIIRQLDEVRAAKPQAAFSLGAFSGDSSLIYLLTHLGELWREPARLEKAEQLALSMEPSIVEDKSFDVLGGAAGYLSVLSGLYDLIGGPKILQSAVKCADYLLGKAEPQERGLAWTNGSNIATAPLTGYSHGTAGIAHALLRITAITGDERYREAALGAIAYERSQFLPDQRNWRDWRDLPSNTDIAPRSMTAWCHGAPGIGLARLKTLALVDDAEARNEIEIALETTARRGFGGNHCLCHGDLGNLELLLEAGREPGYAEWRDVAMRHAGALITFAQQRGWLCSTPNGVETPGLMLGLAGIGYGLLRAADPDAIPSVLTLQPPRRNQ